MRPEAEVAVAASPKPAARANVCGACVFFSAGFEGAPYGLCRIRAPQFGPHGTMKGAWPEVDSDDWCGEFGPEPVDFIVYQCASCGANVKNSEADTHPLMQEQAQAGVGR